MISGGPGRLVRRAGRTVTGGVIIVVVLFALRFMQGPGTGTGDGDISADFISADRSSQFATAVPTDRMVLSSADTQADGLTETEQTAVQENTLVILIDEYDYLMRVPGNNVESWNEIDLQRLLKLAQQIRGDSNGIRVRIHKRSTARASAEQRIIDQLHSVGIGPDAIFESSELID